MKITTVKKLISSSVAETENAAYEFANEYLLSQGDEGASRFIASRFIASRFIASRFIALYGDLGVGKTAFIRGLAKAITPDAEVSSPTYKLVNVYRSSSGGPDICHFDMYRISDDDDLYSIGFYDYFEQNSIIAAEWCEKIEFALPDDYFKVTIEKISYDESSEDSGKRSVTIERVTK